VESHNGELCTLSGHTNLVLTIAISPDGQTLISGSRDKTAKIWKLSTGSLIGTLFRHSDWVLSIGFSPDGQTLFSGSKDKTIEVLSLRAINKLKGRLNQVNVSLQLLWLYVLLKKPGISSLVIPP